MGRQWIVYCVHSARHFLGLSNEGAAMVRIVNRAHSVVDLNGSRIYDWYGALWRLALNFGRSPASDPANYRLVVPAQPVAATPRSQLIRQHFPLESRSVRLYSIRP